MEEIVIALKTMYGVDVGIDTTKLTPLANLVQRLTRLRCASAGE